MTGVGKYFTSDKVYFYSWIAARVVNRASSDLFDSHDEIESIEFELRLLMMMMTKKEEEILDKRMTVKSVGGTDKIIRRGVIFPESADFRIPILACITRLSKRRKSLTVDKATMEILLAIQGKDYVLTYDTL